MPDEIRQMLEYMKHLQDIPIDSMRQGPPDEEELRRVIKKMKSGKASCDVPMEYIKQSMVVVLFPLSICNSFLWSLFMYVWCVRWW